MSEFAGQWFTTFGPLALAQDGAKLRGAYGSSGVIEGELVNGELRFRYEEPIERGQGAFRLTRHGKFAGTYLPEGAAQPRAWNGNRNFDGIWLTSFGRLLLIEEEQRVFGFYEGAGRCTIEGRLEAGRLVFRYQEPAAEGEGWFELSGNGRGFMGQWRRAGVEFWSDWHGQRLLPQPGLCWLVVLEAHWQRSLADNEYAFGHMLREVFARLPNVKVRQRFFHDEASLERWCRELQYVPEPAVLMIASHGTPEGLSVHGTTINVGRVLDSVRHADNLRLLHFSSCLILQDAAHALRTHVGPRTFPISGYSTSVDWGGSALVEMTYLDMILAKGLDPAEAARLLPQVVAFAGDGELPGSPYLPLGFRFIGPN